MNIAMILTLFLVRGQSVMTDVQHNQSLMQNHANEAHECMTIFFPLTQSCCVEKKDLKSFYKDYLKFCQDLPSISPACDFDLCIANKRGFAFDDNIDKRALEMLIHKDFELNEHLIENIYGKCIYGDLSMYGTRDVCEFTKLRRCIESHSLAECPAWKVDGICEGIKDLVDKCISFEPKNTSNS